MRVRRNPIAGHNLFTTFRDANGNTSLHIAVERREYEQVKFYAEYPQLINSVNHCGDTPLHYCAFSDFPEAAEILLSHGAQIDAVNTLDQTPLMLAILDKAYNTVDYLLEKRTATIAKRTGRKKIVYEEVETKIDPFLVDYRKLSIAHYAQLMNDERLKKSILKELAKRKIFFIQEREPNWFDPSFLTLYTRASHRKEMLQMGKDVFAWSLK